MKANPSLKIGTGRNQIINVFYVDFLITISLNLNYRKITFDKKKGLFLNLVKALFEDINNLKELVDIKVPLDN